MGPHIKEIPEGQIDNQLAENVGEHRNLLLSDGDNGSSIKTKTIGSDEDIMDFSSEIFHAFNENSKLIPLQVKSQWNEFLLN